MKFFAVCTLPHYGSKHVYKMLDQLQQYYSGTVELNIYTDRPHLLDDRVNIIPIEHSLCERQWYKVDFMGPMNSDIDEPIIVMDLDLTFLRNIDHIVDIPINPSEFFAIERWWRAPGQQMNINGGMYKYYPSTCHHAFMSFYEKPQFWQNNYRQYSRNPVTGEQYFMFDHMTKTHMIRTFPGPAFVPVRPNKDTVPVYLRMYTECFGRPFLQDDGSYDQDVCVLHG